MKRKILMLTVLSLFACAKRPIIKEAAKAPIIPQPTSVEGELNIRGREFVSYQGLATIYFDFNRVELHAEARRVLAKNADFLKAHPEIEVRVDGHCDERGTTKYNLALGQKRAAIVRDYYVNLGLDSKRLGTLSWGEEKAVCHEKTEACWAKNRRSDTKIREKATSEVQAK